jgi:diacylglycerol kinase (ATP)
MKLINSFKYALRGIWLLLSTERNFKIHFLALILVVSAGLYFSINTYEWLSVLLISAIVMGLEGINSALEKLCDEVTENRKESIRNIKDIAAGAVLIAALIAIVIAALIFKKHLV